MGCRSGTLFLADEDPAVRQVHVRRYLQVVGRGLVLEDAAGHVESRAVAGAEETAGPVVGQRGLGPGNELVAGRAAEVGADADDKKDLGLDRAVLGLEVDDRDQRAPSVRAMARGAGGGGAAFPWTAATAISNPHSQRIPIQSVQGPQILWASP